MNLEDFKAEVQKSIANRKYAMIFLKNHTSISFTRADVVSEFGIFLYYKDHYICNTILNDIDKVAEFKEERIR